MDRPYLLNAEAPLLFDFNDPDSQYVMFNRELEGCCLLPFSEPMAAQGGRVLLHGIPLSARMRELVIGDDRCSVLAIDLAEALHDYAQKAVHHIEGYRNRQGVEMLPTDVSVYTPEKIAPEPRFAAHEQIALQTARDGIVLLKNEEAVLPLQTGSTLNFFGKDLFHFRCCAVIRNGDWRRMVRVFGLGGGEPPEQVTDVQIKRKDRGMTAVLRWPERKDAVGYNVRFGVAPDKLYSSYQVYGTNRATILTLNAGQDYCFAVDAFNESGLTPGRPVKQRAASGLRKL